ncbi:MAG: hypothetical protein BEN19_00200 [Epulopiscium sp. Nuni2H_MBin003]|nr:MAG: hypothetical protein BEN19_00200 [Epulopiscium sp. Nuni2H_MBin003]
MEKDNEMTDLSVFNRKDIIIFGAGRLGKEAKKYLDYLSYTVKYFVVDPEFQQEDKVEGISVITTYELVKLVDKFSDQLIIIIPTTPSVPEVIKKRIRGLLGSHSNVISDISLAYLRYKAYFGTFFNEIINTPFLITSKEFASKMLICSLSSLYIEDQTTTIFLCLASKTGDFTLGFTFKKYGIPNFNFWHRVDKLAEFISNYKKKIKLVFGVREPISQNLSNLNHLVSDDPQFLALQILQELENTSKDKNIFINEMKELYVNNFSNIQLLFDNFINSCIYNDNMDLHPFVKQFTMQNFISLYNERIVNLFDYPFDKESGYSIIQHNNLEIFIYQLEKLNDIIPHLSKWTGVEFNELVLGNVGADKWSADTYKKAQKDIKFSKEYFDRCFNEQYVHHFYTESDINKFKKRWKSHIK